MKRVLVIAAMLFLLVGVVTVQTGCSAKHPIHAGAINQADSDVYDSLLTCQAALEQAKIEFGSNQSAKPILNQAIVSYNTARDGYLAYRAGASNNLIAVQSQIANIMLDIGSLKSQFGGGLKAQ